MNKNEIILNEIDNIIDRIQNETLESQKFENYSKIFKFTYNKNYKIHKNKKNCAIPGCTKKSIQRSHSIPKSASLNLISTDGNLFQPEMNLNSTTLSVEMKPIGKDLASTFPGYCVDHEKIFSNYEDNGQIQTAKDIGLQSFRAINRETIFRECELEINEKEIIEYKKRLETEAKSILERNIRSHSIDPDTIIKDIKFGLNDKQIQQREFLNVISRDKISILKKITYDIYEDLPDLDNYTCCSIMTDIKYPIALSGFTNFKIDKFDEDIYVVMNIIPTNDGTYIILLVKKGYSIVLEYITNKYFKDELQLTVFIENIMIHGSDHWYIKPSYWDTFEANKQDRILSHILQINKTILEDYEYSIFDDIKMSIIEEYKRNPYLINSEIRKIIKREIRKIKNSNNWIKMEENELSNRIVKQYLGN